MEKLQAMKRIVLQVFPYAQVEEVDNFDDNSSGLIVGIKPMESIAIKKSWNDADGISINMKRMYAKDEKVNVKKIFHGRLPLLSDNSIDWNFFKTLLIHYKKIG